MTYVCPRSCQYAEDVGVPGAADPPCPGGYCYHYAPEDPAMPEPSPADRAQAILDDLTTKETETLRIVLTAALSVSRSVIAALPPDLRARLLREGLAAAGEQPVEQLATDCIAAEAAIDRVRALLDWPVGRTTNGVERLVPAEDLRRALDGP